MTSREYKLVEADTKESLDAQVESLGKEGWILVAERPQSAAMFSVSMVRTLRDLSKPAASCPSP